jgi:hypothetical protein
MIADGRPRPPTGLQNIPANRMKNFKLEALRFRYRIGCGALMISRCSGPMKLAGFVKERGLDGC